MVKKLIFTLIFTLFISLNSSVALAGIGNGLRCDKVANPTGESCNKGPKGESFSCQKQSNSNISICNASAVRDAFGEIKAPDALSGLVGLDKTGEEGISKFLSNLVSLIFSLAVVVLVLMIVWGAWDWITSEGDKEKLQGAQKKIINAIIGIMLFAASFAIIQVLGQFTGFEFFVGQNPPTAGP